MTFPNGTTSVSTFDTDFIIAEAFGLDAVQDTFNRAYKEWKDDYKMLTELCVICNLFCWDRYYKGQDVLSKMYADMYYKTRSYALNHFKGEAFQWFWSQTD